MRSGALAVAVGVLAALLGWAASPAAAARYLVAHAADRAGDPSTVAVDAGALIAWAVVGWLALAITVSLATRLPGTVGEIAARVSQRVSPAVVRRLVGAGVAVGVAASPAYLATAAGAAPPAHTVVVRAAVSTTTDPCVVDGLPDLDRGCPTEAPTQEPTTAPAPTTVPLTPSASRSSRSGSESTPTSSRAPGSTTGSTTGTSTGDGSTNGRVDPAGPRSTADPGTPGAPGGPSGPTGPADPRAQAPTSGAGGGEPTTYAVTPGDCLWDIARRELRSDHLPTDDAAVAARWPAWWAANRAEIGPDPDLIHPGTTLVAPATPPQEDR